MRPRQPQTYIFTTAIGVAGMLCLYSAASADNRIAVSGAMDAWNVWHFATDTVSAGCIPPQKICIESAVPAEPVTTHRDRLHIPVAGEAGIQAGRIVRLTLAQTARVSMPVAGARGNGGRLHLAGLRWMLIDGRLVQTGTAKASCDPLAGPGCKAIASRIADPAMSDSPVDFDGIPDQFPIQLGALRLNHHEAFAADAGDLTAISINVASHSPAVLPLSPLFNAAGVAHFTLTVIDEPDVETVSSGFAEVAPGSE